MIYNRIMTTTRMSNRRLPNYYAPLLSEEQFFLYAQRAWDVALSKGLTPVAASVVGSHLRGTSHSGSDLDTMVVVEEDRKLFAKHIHGDDYDVLTESLEFFLLKYGVSIPFQEFLSSPFLLVAPKWKPFLSSLRYSSLETTKHGQKMVTTVLSSKSVLDEKKARAVAGLYHLCTTGQTLVPREYAELPAYLPQVEAWVKETYQEDVSENVLCYFRD